MKVRGTVQESNETKSWFSEKILKKDNSLGRLSN